MEDLPTGDDKVPKDAWNEPPPPPERESVISDLSCQGTLALTLRNALQEFQEREQSIDIDRIMQAFGEAVAQSQQEQFQLEAADNTITPDVPLAPAALLRGRVHHYNRLGTKWRFLVEDVEIHPRKPLDKHRRKRERHSLWIDAQEPVMRIPRLELLLYDDME